MLNSLQDHQEAIAYLLARVEQDPISGCWLWRLSVGSHGYGQCFWQGKVKTAHRMSYQLFNGDPGDLFVLHQCGNRRCCNPDHLYAGTQLDNFHDMVRHGTHVPPPKLKGEEVGNSVLTDKQASEIKRGLLRGVSAVQLSRAYGVSPSTIGLIKQNKRYKHVEPCLPDYATRVRLSVTKDQVMEVQRRLANGDKNRTIAHSMNLNESTVSRIKLGKIQGL